MAGKLDIIIDQGATFSRVYTYKVNDVAVDISANTIRGQVRKKHTSATAAATFTTGFFTDGTDGKFTVELTDTETAGLSAGDHVYDIEMVFNDGTVKRLIEGVMSVTPEVTR